MSDAITVALITGALALAAALGAAWLQDLSAPRRLERQAAVLKTLGPLAKDPELSSARHAFDNVAKQLARRTALLSRWWQVGFGVLTLFFLTMTIFQAVNLVEFILRWDGYTLDSTHTPVSETLDYQMSLALSVLAVSGFAIAAVICALQTVLRQYGPFRVREHEAQRIKEDAKPAKKTKSSPGGPA